MKIIQHLNAIRKTLHSLSSEGIRSIGFVPTMGALHEGHLSLIRRARKQNDLVVVSIFVNPLQFGPREDLTRYPRPRKRDLALCRKEKVDILFTPVTADFYPPGHSTFVTVEGLSTILCGSSRPGHFRGVTTVVAKLFHAIRPDRAYFGMKDLQQTIVIRRMVRDLAMDIRIVPCPIVREKDGLALSSRNAYLDGNERVRALSLFRSLQMGRNLYKKGERSAGKIRKGIISTLLKGLDGKKDRIEYVEIVDRDTLEKKKKAANRTVAVLAVRIGRTRLIDNLTLAP